MTTEAILEKVNLAKYAVMQADTEEKNRALRLSAEALLRHTDEILSANAADLKAAEGKISEVMTDRLRLTKERIEGMAQGIFDVAALPDPVGSLMEETTRPNGLKIRKIRTPMGVIAIIYESRPNVTSDAAALALKAGSAVVLRSGKEAHKSAAAIVAAMKEGLKASSIPEDALMLIEDTSRESAQALMKAHGKIDLLIPRGGRNLIRACVENATVPVLETGTGICHIYVDQALEKDAQEKVGVMDFAAALRIIENAKCSRPSVCNAEEVLLIHEKTAEAFLPLLKKTLVDDRIARHLTPVELRLDPASASYISGVPAGPDDFDTEFLDYILAVKVVHSVKEAIDHVNRHSTGHSESILSNDPEALSAFASGVDSACVYTNCSTRFTDGGEFGFGAEMGISTQKLHARGPLGLRELCTFKFVIEGCGQVR